MSLRRCHRTTPDPARSVRGSPDSRIAATLRAWLLAGLLGSPAAAAPSLRLAILGDSLSAEYDSITGVAGVDDPTEYAAITVPGWESMSWVEVLGRMRPATVSLGAYGTNLLAWGIFRFSGYEYNFAVPGFEAAHFEQIVNSSLLSDPQFLPYKLQIAEVLEGPADAAVVWLGGNEFRARYGSLYDGEDPAAFIDRLSSDLQEVLDFVRARRAGLKLVVVNLPDLGATPDKQAAHPDPLRRARVTAATALANQAIAQFAAARGIPVADVSSDTDRLLRGETLWIGPVNIRPGSHPDNAPRHAFTRDGLHPNTVLQAVIARRIVDTFNQAHAAAIAPITDAEILDLAGLDPLQPYLEWVETNAVPAGGLGDDPDGDRIPNLAEFVFGLDPNSPSPGPLSLEGSGPSLVAGYRPDPDRLRLAEVRPERSVDLAAWEPVPESELIRTPEGRVAVMFPPGGSSAFVRLRIFIRPLN